MTREADEPGGPVTPDSVKSLEDEGDSSRDPLAVTREEGSLADGRSITYYWLKGTDRLE